MEIWKDIDGLNGEYQISSVGNIRHIKAGEIKVLKSHKDTDGYLIITLYIKKKLKCYKIHRLVAQAFIPNPNNLPQVNHKDCNKANNYVDNLEWCSSKQNIEHAVKNKLFDNRDYSKRFKKVNQYDLEGNFIKTWDSIKEAGKTLRIDTSSISKVCNANKINKSSGKFIWKYAK